MYVLKHVIIIFFFFFINNCSFIDSQENEQRNNYYIEIETPSDKYNIYFRESLKRFFYNQNNEATRYKLEASIKFQSTDTLSISGTSILKSTKAKINYLIKSKNTNKLLKSGSISTFPALSSTSTSLYSKEKSIEHIKKRLVKSSAKTLYMRINLLMRSLS